MKRQALEKLLNGQAAQLGVSNAQLKLSGLRDQLRGTNDEEVVGIHPKQFLAFTSSGASE